MFSVMDFTTLYPSLPHDLIKEAMEAEEDPELITVVKINSNSNIKIKRLILRSHMKIKRVSNLWERLVRFSLSIKKMLYRRKSKRSSLK